MNKAAEETLAAIRRPLEYASKQDFSNLEKVKDLSTLIPSLTDKVSPHLTERAAPSLKKLSSLFEGFDSLPHETKKASLTEALQLVHHLMSGDGSAPIPPRAAKESPNNAAGESSVSTGVDTPIQFIKGVGPRIGALLTKKGISTVEKALYFFPFRYDDRRNLKKISALIPGEVQQVAGDVLVSGEVPLRRGGRKIFEAVIGDGTGTLTLKWFNYNKKYMKERFADGKRFLLSGEVKLFGSAKEILHPDVELLDPGEDELESFKTILPVYHLTEGLALKTLRKIMARVVDGYAGSLVDGLPEEVQRKKDLVSLETAMRAVHLPEKEADMALLSMGQTAAHMRLVYDEFFFLQLGIALRKRGMDVAEGIMLDAKGSLKKRLLGSLPFSLTAAQNRVIGEIEADMATSHPMHRLIQGDVGCGKTIVALAAALDAVECGYQAAIMAPTEILAEQHYINIHPLTEALGLKTELITGGVKGKVKRSVVDDITSGKVDIVIGTHALIQEGIAFKKLGLGVIDEQHRFGVLQRARIGQMGAGGKKPNILVMTATPIPRSLAMTVYGDLELSIIDELPPGRQTIDTSVHHERGRAKVYRIIGKELKKGRQAYVVYPLVEESEKMDLMDATRMADELAEQFKDYRIGLIHGRLKVEEKEAVMGAFKAGEIHLLVSTTVIEVGIDVPNATVMVVEHAERFGLSQLHQLRGRVGRGSDKSLCILLAQYKKSDEARERLAVMERSTNGFDIAEADLKIRGPGDFLGTRQSGMPDFRIGNILRDDAILKEAREDAFAIVEKDPALERPEHELLRGVLKERWQGRLEVAGVG